MKKEIIKAIKQIYWDAHSILSSKSIQKRLDYPRNTKMLIIHADDMGMSASENNASIEVMEKGMVNSGSVMVPCPGFKDMADYLMNHKNCDAGIHLTLTSEWPSYKWRPLLPASEVPSIVDSAGYLLLTKKEFNRNADADEVEKECRAQINMALEAGIELTHIDSHMYTAFSNDRILQKYILLGNEFKLPVLLTHELPSWVRKSEDAVVVDRLYCAEQKNLKEGLDNYYIKVLKSVKPGFNCLLVHPAFDNTEMKDIALDKISFGSAWRQSDFDFFTSDKCRRIIKDNNIQLITWREIRDRLLRKN